MTPIEKVKALTNYKEDAKINVYIEMVKEELVEICKLETYTPELDNILVDMVIVKLNQSGNEGLSSVNISGANESYLNEYPHYIRNRLKKWTRRVVMR